VPLSLFLVRWNVCTEGRRLYARCDTCHLYQFLRSRISQISSPSTIISIKTMMSPPSNKLNAEDTKSSLAYLFRLIEANDWRRLNRVFLTEPEGRKTFQQLAALVADSSSFNGMTILHACSRFNPPPHVILRIIELCPDAPRARDCLDRTPLHVMAGTCAASFVIEVLVDAFPEACMMQDMDGRTPLHFACDSSCELFEDNNSKNSIPRPPPSYRTIDVLVKASYDSVILEDEDGMSAIEYALCSNADLQTVKLLQRAAQKVMIRKQEEDRLNKAKAPAPTKQHAPSSSLTSKLFTLRRGVQNAPSA